MARRPISQPDDARSATLIVPFMLAGTGMALVFADRGQRGARRRCAPSEAGQASGATNAIREVGGVMGVAVLAAVFAANGGYESPRQSPRARKGRAPIDGARPRVQAVLGPRR